MRRSRMKIITMAALAVVLTGCGNKNIGFSKMTFNFITCNQDFAPLKNESIHSWKDFEDGEQIEVSTSKGTFLVSSNYCFLHTNAQ